MSSPVIPGREDAFALHGVFERFDITRASVFRITVVFFAAVPLALNLLIEAPLVLFAISGILFAPAIGLMYLAALYMSYKEVDLPELHPQRTWAVAIAIFAAIALIASGLFEAL